MTNFGMFSNDDSFYNNSQREHQQHGQQQPFSRSYLANTIEELKFGSRKFIENCRRSRKLVLLVVFIALFFDNMLLTTIVPIIPEYLYNLENPNDTYQYKQASVQPNVTTTTTIMDNMVGVDMKTMATRNFGPAREPMEKRSKSKLISELSSNSDIYDEMFLRNSKATNLYSNMRHKRSSRTEREPEVEYYDDDEDEVAKKVTQPIEMAKATSTTINDLETKTKGNEEEAKDVWKRKQLNRLNTKVGLMFASKPIVQLMTNPFIGPLTNRIGYSVPMFVGFIIMFVSTLTFAFSDSYALLFVARAIQGVGSACSSVAGLGMLADRYTNDEERGSAMGIALGGLAMGVLIGPPFGGIVYQYLGKEAPFVILASLGVIDGILQLLVLKPGIQKEAQEGAPLKTLIRDPYILTAAGAITFANMGIAMMEPSLPIWMMNTMNPEKWQLGAAFLPASISYLIGTNLFGPIAHKMGRWLCSMFGLIIIGLSLLIVPTAKSIYGLIIPNSGLGFAIGMVDSSMMPAMAYLVDIRHASVYGSVYAIADVAFCLGFAIGPAMSGFIVSGIGFPAMLIIIALLCIGYAPFMYFLKNPPAKEEKMSLIINNQSQSIKYVRYTTRNQSPEISEVDDY